MPRIPGVPTLDPVNQPTMSPGEAGRVGGAVSQMGDTMLETSQMEYQIRTAQQHVDTLAARNQLDAAYAATQDDLLKTQNSRDVPAVIEQGNRSLNDISKQWSNSPASVAIQQEADSLRPSLTRVGTVRRVDLMGKELKITLAQHGEALAGEYANGNRDVALAAYTAAVDAPGSKLLMGDAERGEYIRQFKQSGQELQIKNGITNANPEVNQKTYDDITQHRDQFPDVTQEQLDTFKGQALAAFEAHTKFQDWAEGQMALKTQLVPKINQFTNPATGHFDESSAMTDNANRLARGEITETQSNVLAQGYRTHAAQLEFGLKTEAGKRLDDIEKDLAKHDFATAAKKLEDNKPWFENNGFSDDYRAALRYTGAKQAEVRAESAAARTEQRYEYYQARQEAQDQSQDQLAKVQHFIAAGGVLTKSDLFDMSGTGPGKMQTRDVDAAWKMMDTYEKEPDFAAGLKYLDDNFKIPTGAAAKNVTPDYIASQNKKYADTVELFQQQVNAHPDKSKLEIAHDLVKSENAKQIKDHADRMFGTAPTASRVMDSIKNFLSAPFTYGLRPGDAGYKPPASSAAPPAAKSAPIVQHSASTGKDRYSLDNGQTWLPGKPPQQ